MPLVRVIYDPKKFDRIADLKLACSHLVPAMFNIDHENSEGRLTPGSIRFFARPMGPDDDNGGDHVFIDMETFYYPERAAILPQRTREMAAALESVFPVTEFALWPKLVAADWYSSNHDPEFDGDLSMTAALDRVHAALKLRTPALDEYLSLVE